MAWTKLVSGAAQTWQNAQDDWSGIASAAERRKRQNRVNVRAHRKRKAALSGRQATVERYLVNSELRGIDLVKRVSGEEPERRPWLLVECVPTRQWNKEPMDELFRSLPQDKHFAPLARYNLSRAVATNMKILSIESVPVSETCSFILGDIELFPGMPTNVPESLRPTKLQTESKCDAWINLFPCPTLRDNMILKAGHYGRDEFLYDAAGRLEHECQNGESSTSPGLLVWSNPWTPYGWEMTETFMQKWRFLLEGCHDLVAATNHWRGMRGEPPVDNRTI